MDPSALVREVAQVATDLGLPGLGAWLIAHPAWVLIGSWTLAVPADVVLQACRAALRDQFSTDRLAGFLESKVWTPQGKAALGLLLAWGIAATSTSPASPGAQAALMAFATAAFALSVPVWRDVRDKARALLLDLIDLTSRTELPSLEVSHG